MIPIQEWFPHRQDFAERVGLLGDNEIGVQLVFIDLHIRRLHLLERVLHS